MALAKDYSFNNQHRYIPYLVKVLYKRGQSQPKDIYDEVANLAGITAEEKGVQGNSGETVYTNRIQFARQDLVDADIIVGPSSPDGKWGFWMLTETGKALVNRRQTNEEFEIALNDRLKEERRKKRTSRKESLAMAGIEDEGSVDERDNSEPEVGLPSIIEALEEANALVFSAMLEHIRSIHERKFEILVGEVLRLALKADSVQITQASRDGGFDGILTFDSLKMRTAVFEAKRYAEGNIVQRRELDVFATARRRTQATHAIFVTSSSFSSGAYEAAKGEDIRLINGEAFVALMAKHKIGLQVQRQFSLYEIDPNWSLDESDW